MSLMVINPATFDDLSRNIACPFANTNFCKTSLNKSVSWMKATPLKISI